MCLKECLASSPQTQTACYLLLAFLCPQYEGVFSPVPPPSALNVPVSLSSDFVLTL